MSIFFYYIGYPEIDQVAYILKKRRSEAFVISSYNKMAKNKFVCNDNTTTVTVKINVLKEKRAIFHHIKEIAFEYEGIIFGGMVRDEIIAEHYKKEFNVYNKNNEGKSKSSGNSSNDFWNKEYHPESIARTITPNDMDIYFVNTSDVANFEDIIKDEFEDSIINIVDEVGPIKYGGLLSQFKSKKITIEYMLGKTFTFSGYKITIKIDVIYATDVSIKIEPPFNNLDMLCNGFIQLNDGSKRLSNNTGTELDSLPYIQKMSAISKILKDMTNFKTEICQIVSKKDIRYCVERYLKMLERSNGFSWEILNLPYSLVEPTHERCTEKICCICQENIIPEKQEDYDKIAIITTNKLIAVKEGENTVYVKGKEMVDCTKIHHKCLLKYIKTQISRKPNEDEDKDAFRVVCPFKKQINYSYCFRKIDWDKYIK